MDSGKNEYHQHGDDHQRAPDSDEEPSPDRHMHLLRLSLVSCASTTLVSAYGHRSPTRGGSSSRLSLRFCRPQKRAGSTYSPHSARSALQISPRVASARAAASIGSIMLPSLRAPLIIPPRAASTAALSRAARRALRASHCSTSTSWLTRRISNGLVIVAVCTLTP